MTAAVGKRKKEAKDSGELALEFSAEVITNHAGRGIHNFEIQPSSFKHTKMDSPDVLSSLIPPWCPSPTEPGER